MNDVITNNINASSYNNDGGVLCESRIMDSSIEERKFSKKNTTNNTTNNNNKVKLKIVIKKNIYRYKFSDEFMNQLYVFSKLHQYDDRKLFKESWNEWKEENEELINCEIRRLTELDYEGDILDKMFKSARYYFRKKGTEKKEPKQRRQYISVSKELLEAMDNHIETNSFQPKDGFIDFCKNNEFILKESISLIFEQGSKDKDLIEDKIKKTYKNRYFMISNK